MLYCTVMFLSMLMMPNYFPARKIQYILCLFFGLIILRSFCVHPTKNSLVVVLFLGCANKKSRHLKSAVHQLFWQRGNAFHWKEEELYATFGDLSKKGWIGQFCWRYWKLMVWEGSCWRQKAFYKNSKANVRLTVEIIKSFRIGVRERQDCVMWRPHGWTV